MRRWALGALAPLAAALALPAAGGAAVTGSTRLHITPARPGPHTNVVVRFRQPTLGGLLPADQTTESLRVDGPTRPGCGGPMERTVTTLEAGTAMRETLRPARRPGGRWCPGLFRVSLQVSQSTSCPVGPQRHVCPVYIVAPRTVATARFRVYAG